MTDSFEGLHPESGAILSLSESLTKSTLSLLGHCSEVEFSMESTLDNVLVFVPWLLIVVHMLFVP